MSRRGLLTEPSFSSESSFSALLGAGASPGRFRSRTQSSNSIGDAVAVREFGKLCGCNAMEACFEVAEGMMPLDDGPQDVSRASLLEEPHMDFDVDDNYRLCRELGRGAFGVVHEAEMLPTSWADTEDLSRFPVRKTAVKVFCEASTLDPPMALLLSSHDRTEVQMLARMEHPNVVRMFECFVSQTGSLAVVQEFCQGGDLHTSMLQEYERSGGGLGEGLSQALFKQMLRALRHVHNLHIVHRDIKPENFLLLRGGELSKANMLKLCDFGTAVQLSFENSRAPGRVGTFVYASPEIFANRGVSFPGDAWSLGVVLYAMVMGMNPFVLPGTSSSDRDNIQPRIEAGDFYAGGDCWMGASEPYRDLVGRLLSVEEASRCSCQEALNHSWYMSPADGDRESADEADGPVGPALFARLAQKAAPALRKLKVITEAQGAALMACSLSVAEADLDPEVPWSDMFFHFDQDQDDRLSYAEFGQLLLGMEQSCEEQVLGVLTPDRLRVYASAIDFDHSGYIEWVEFLAFGLLCSVSVGTPPEGMSCAQRLISSAVHAQTLAALAGGLPRRCEEQRAGLSQGLLSLWDRLS